MWKCCHANPDFAVLWTRSASVLALTADMRTVRRLYTDKILGLQI